MKKTFLAIFGVIIVFSACENNDDLKKQIEGIERQLVIQDSLFLLIDSLKTENKTQIKTEVSTSPEKSQVETEKEEDSTEEPAKPIILPEPTYNGNDPYNGHEYVDFGFPSGILWATCNIGADSPEKVGECFAWGETTAKGAIFNTSQDHTTYKFYNYYNYEKSKVIYSNYNEIDGKTTLNFYDDAAQQNWKGIWRMPTKEEFDELLGNTYMISTSNYKNKNVSGLIIFKAKQTYHKKYDIQKNSEKYDENTDLHIFLPTQTGVGWYWTRSLNYQFYDKSYFYSNAYYCQFTNVAVQMSVISRYYALCIRPVCKKR